MKTDFDRLQTDFAWSHHILFIPKKKSEQKMSEHFKKWHEGTILKQFVQLSSDI